MLHSTVLELLRSMVEEADDLPQASRRTQLRPARPSGLLTWSFVCSSDWLGAPAMCSCVACRGPPPAPNCPPAGSAGCAADSPAARPPRRVAGRPRLGSRAAAANGDDGECTQKLVLRAQL